MARNATTASVDGAMGLIEGGPDHAAANAEQRAAAAEAAHAAAVEELARVNGEIAARRELSAEAQALFETVKAEIDQRRAELALINSDIEGARANLAEAQAAAEAAVPASTAALSLVPLEGGFATAAELLAWANADTRYLIFGDGSTATLHVPAIAVAPGTWTLRDGGLHFGGDFTLLGDPKLGNGRTVSMIALADGADGPVRAVGDISRMLLRAGDHLRFGPGAFVFRS